MFILGIIPTCRFIQCLQNLCNMILNVNYDSHLKFSLNALCYINFPHIKKGLRIFEIILKISFELIQEPPGLLKF